MSSPNPFSGGGTSLGVAEATVRVKYESVGAGAATGQLEQLEHNVAQAGASFDSLAAKANQSIAAINQATQAHSRFEPKTLTGTGVFDQRALMAQLGAMTALIRQELAPALDLTQHVKIEATARILAEARSVGEQMGQAAASGYTKGFGAPRISTPHVTSPITPTGHYYNPTIPNSPGLPAQHGANSSPIPVSVTNWPAGGAGQSSSGHGGGAAEAAGLASVATRFGVIGTAAAAALAPVGALGYALHGGFERLEGLDSAAIKMKALGYSGNQVSSIMNSALESVNKTRYSLDEAAQTAVQALSAGIQPGQDLDKYLKTVANSAELAQTSMADMGYIFNQAATQTKLQSDQLQELQTRGVPVLKYLAEEYGVTQQKASEMVSSGAVDFAHFEDAMAKATDGMADKMGGTVQGSIQNFETSIKKLGAALLAPLFGNATGEASEFATRINELREKIEGFTNFVKSHQSDIVGFWETGAKGALLFAQAMTDVIGWTMEGFGQLERGLSGFSKGVAAVADFFGAHGIADNARDTAKSHQEWGDAAFGAGQKVFGFNQTITQGFGAIDKWADKARNAKAAAGDLGASLKPQPAVSFTDALDKLEIKADQAGKAINGTTKEFKEFIGQLVEKGASKELIETVSRLHTEFNNGGSAAQEFSDALDQLGDSSVSAEQKAKALDDALKNIGQVPMQDAVVEYDDAVQKILDSAKKLQFGLMEARGNQIVGADGVINANTANARELIKNLKEIRLKTEQVALSSEATPQQAWEESHKNMQMLLQDFGIVGDTAEQVITKYLTPEHTFEVNVQMKNAPEVQRTLDVLSNEIDAAKQKADSSGIFNLPVEKDQVQQVQKILGELGASVQSYDPIGKNLKVSIPPEKQDQIKSQLQGIFANDPTKLPSTLDIKTTQQDIVEKITGGASALHIQTILDIQGIQGMPGAGGKPGQGGQSFWGYKPDAAGAPNQPAPQQNSTQGGHSHSEFGGAPADGKPPIDPSKITGQSLFDSLKNEQEARVQNQSIWDSLTKQMIDPSDLSFGGLKNPTPKNFDSLLGMKPNQINDLLGQNKDIAATLGPQITQAQQQGMTFAQAFAQGIRDGSDAVRQAIIELAALAGGGLGNSPALYGPLSGSGWTYNRGQVFTSAYATGIASGAGEVRSAATSVASSGTKPLDDQIDQFVKDAGDWTHISNTLLSFATQLQGVATQSLTMMNLLKGNNTLAPWSPTATGGQVGASFLGNQVATGLGNQPAQQGPGGAAKPGAALSGATVPLVQNPDGTWTSSDPEWAKLIKRESSGKADNVNTDPRDANAGPNASQGLFQFTPETWHRLGFTGNPKDAPAQVQAQAAAKLLQQNPSGSDWGLNLGIGREDPSKLLAGLQGSGGSAGLGGSAGFASDSALLSKVPSGQYLQTQAADLAAGIGDCSSAVEDLINMMDGASTAGRQMATGNASKWLTAHGFLPTDTPVSGAFNVGFNDHHMQATLPGGTPFNWGGSDSAANRGIGGSGAFDPSFTQHYFRPVAPPPPQAGGPRPPGSPSGATGFAPGMDMPAPPQVRADVDLQDYSRSLQSAPDASLFGVSGGYPFFGSPISPGAPSPALRIPLSQGAEFGGANWAGGNLSPEQMKALRSYTSSSMMNYSLREGDVTGRMEEHVRNLDSALEGSPRVPQDIVTSRFLPGQAFGGIEPGNLSSIVGKTFTDPGYTSTHLGVNTDKISPGANGDYLMELTVPKGSQGLYVPSQGPGLPTQAYGENELLLGRGGQYTPTSVYRNPLGQQVIRAQYGPYGGTPEVAPEFTSMSALGRAGRIAGGALGPLSMLPFAWDAAKNLTNNQRIQGGWASTSDLLSGHQTTGNINTSPLASPINQSDPFPTGVNAGQTSSPGVQGIPQSTIDLAARSGSPIPGTLPSWMKTSAPTTPLSKDTSTSFWGVPTTPKPGGRVPFDVTNPALYDPATGTYANGSGKPGGTTPVVVTNPNQFPGGNPNTPSIIGTKPGEKPIPGLGLALGALSPTTPGFRSDLNPNSAASQSTNASPFGGNRPNPFDSNASGGGIGGVGGDGAGMTMQKVMGAAQAASGIASDVIQTIDATLKAVAATKNATDIAVRGVANTADVNKLVDDVQTYITVAQKAIQTGGDITQTVGAFTQGGGGFGDGGATAAAGQIVSLISQVMGAVNTGIDLVQEGYQLTMKYVGRNVQQWLGLSGSSDIRYLLDEQTGQMQAYSSDNPMLKTTLNTLDRERGNPRYAGKERSNPSNTFNIYQGPGQDPRDTMNDAMFAVKASGQGAFGGDF
jgi:tape measure domain-containing protein